jgi:hypothetical protein
VAVMKVVATVMADAVATVISSTVSAVIPTVVSTVDAVDRGASIVKATMDAASAGLCGRNADDANADDEDEGKKLIHLLILIKTRHL